jgi:hypothetical protein
MSNEGDVCGQWGHQVLVIHTMRTRNGALGYTEVIDQSASGCIQ